MSRQVLSTISIPRSTMRTKLPRSRTGGTITSPAGSYNPANGIMLNGSNGVPLNLTGSARRVTGLPWAVLPGTCSATAKTSLRGGYGLTYYETASQGCDEGICLGLSHHQLR